MRQCTFNLQQDDDWVLDDPDKPWEKKLYPRWLVGMNWDEFNLLHAMGYVKRKYLLWHSGADIKQSHQLHEFWAIMDKVNDYSYLKKTKNINTQYRDENGDVIADDATLTAPNNTS